MIIKFRIIQNYQKFEIVEGVDHPKSQAELDSKMKKISDKEREPNTENIGGKKIT